MNYRLKFLLKCHGELFRVPLFHVPTSLLGSREASSRAEAWHPYITVSNADNADAVKINLEIGYFPLVILPTTGNTPGIGCGPWALATGADGSTKSPSGMKASGECPNSELRNFCQRFGCPQTLRFSDTLAFQIQSGSGQSLTVNGSVINGKSQTVTCGRSFVTYSGNRYRTNICYLDL